MRSRKLSVGGIGVALVVSAALVPASASASGLSWDGTRYVYEAAPGESNRLRIEYGEDTAGAYIQFDDSYTMIPDGSLSGQDCSYGSDNSIILCDRVANPLVDTGDEVDDVQGDISAEGGPEEIHAGAGDDVLRGGDGDDTLDGGPGQDRIEEHPAVGAGNDLVIGGEGLDATVYSCTLGCTEAVTVRLDALANDGPAGHSDNVQTERVDAGDGNDLLVGGPAAERLFGGGGDDELRGGDGNDLLDGDLGADRIYGGGGDDTLRDSSATNDLLDGGAGRDEIVADGPCFSIGCDPGGNDTIHAVDGTEDVISCLGGADSAFVDPSDQLLPDRGGCETIGVQGGGSPVLSGAPSVLPGPPPVDPVASAPSRIGLAKLLRRGLALTVECGAPCTFSARLFFARRRTARLVRIGSGSGGLQAAGSGKLRVTLTRKGKRALRSVRRATLTLRTKVTQAGSVTRSTKKVKVRRN
jgi:hypothetical protein